MPTPLSAVSIANLALARIGATQQITALGPPDPSAAAQQCQLWYNFCRQDLLHEFPWPWARKFAQLNLVQTAPNEAWTYAYRMPADALFVRRLTITPTPQNAIPQTTPITYPQQYWPTYDRSDVNAYPPPFQVGSDSDGQLIYTDLINASVEYTRDAEDTAQFPVEFSGLLAWRLAIELAAGMANDPAKIAFANRMYEQEKWKASAHSMNEEQNSHPFFTWNSEFVRGRYTV